MPAYLMPGIPEEDPRAAGVLPWVEIGRPGAGDIPERHPQGAAPGFWGVTSLTPSCPAGAGPRARHPDAASPFARRRAVPCAAGT